MTQLTKLFQPLLTLCNREIKRCERLLNTYQHTDLDRREYYRDRLSEFNSHFKDIIIARDTVTELIGNATNKSVDLDQDEELIRDLINFFGNNPHVMMFDVRSHLAETDFTVGWLDNTGLSETSILTSSMIIHILVCARNSQPTNI